MKFQDYLRRAADLFEIASSVFDTISRMTKNVTDDRAAAVVKAISAIVETARTGFSGAITPDEVKRHLATLTTLLADNDSDADAALRKKFETESDPA